MPAASKIDASRYVVVVLPLVPVMPTSTQLVARIAVEGRRQRRERQPRVAHVYPRHGVDGRRAPLFATRSRSRRARSPAGERGAVGVHARSATNTEPARPERESYDTA